MSYPKSNTKRVTIARPATASKEVLDTIYTSLETHYVDIIKAEQLIANRKGCYAMIINTTTVNPANEQRSLENTVGTIDAKAMTEGVLNALTLRYSSISIK